MEKEITKNINNPLLYFICSIQDFLRNTYTSDNVLSNSYPKLWFS